MGEGQGTGKMQILVVEDESQTVAERVQIALYKMERRRISEGWPSITLGSISDARACTSGKIAFVHRRAIGGMGKQRRPGQAVMDLPGLYEESSTQAANNPILDLLQASTACIR